MSKPLPKGKFAWKKVMPTEEQILAKKEHAKCGGWILEVDLDYPVKLHKANNGHPLALEKTKIEKEWMSDYQKILEGELGSNQNETKLVLTLQDKRNYVVHYRNLQFYLKEGMILQRVHRTLEFDQECWMRPYNRMNTEFRKQATNEFEKNFYKLMNNSVFGKTMENVQKRDNIKIVRSDKREKIRTLIASPLFSNDLAGFNMHKESVKQDKPFYAGMTILHNNKILMNDFYYNELKRQYDLKFELIYTDTESLLLEVQTNEVYKDMEGSKHLHDTSDYPKDHPFYSSTNETV